MTSELFFDASLPEFARAVRDVIGASDLEAGCFLRDATGGLTFVTVSPLPPDAIRRLEQGAAAQLAPYVDAARGVFATEADLGEPGIVAAALRIPVRVPGESTWRRLGLVDRRIVGQDWTRPPAEGWRSSEPARLVFWSLKGGVGRTTALAVTAAHLARQGRRVVAIDLDLEAPGLGSVLLPPAARPAFGALDWFVEYAVRGRNVLRLDDLLGHVPVIGGSGVLRVLPAVGRLGSENPGNVITKLGRAYLDDMDEAGRTRTFLDKTRELADFVLGEGEFDVLLVDARAGLNEATAAALLGLGADVLMFGVNTPQTFEGFRYCLAHLGAFPADAELDWRLRLKMVHAKASTSEQGRELFRDRAFELFRENFYDNGSADPEDTTFGFGVDDPEAPHTPWVVFDAERYREFDPLAAPDQLTEHLTEATFGDLLRGVVGRASP